MTEPTPIETLRRVLMGNYPSFSREPALAALADVEAAVAALGEILPRLQYNHEALLMCTSLEHKIGSDPDCLGCIAYSSGQAVCAKFQVKP